MKSILLRHGRPQMPKWPAIAPREMGRWIAAYNRSGIDSDHRLALRLQSRVIEIAPPPYRYDHLQVGLSGRSSLPTPAIPEAADPASAFASHRHTILIHSSTAMPAVEPEGGV